MKIGYARVSTADQNPQMQITALKKAGCTQIITEKASGGNNKRPQLKKLLESLQKGDTLTIWKLSRLARSLSHVIEIVKTLETKGANLEVLSQKIDTRTPEGKLFFHMTAAFDEFQRELIVENTHIGLIEARERGRKGGRPLTLSENKKRTVEALIRDKSNFPFIRDVIKAAGISKATFYRHFPADEIRKLRA
jgi:DNA invertase Pin-like site-specific DNA recombinase